MASFSPRCVHWQFGLIVFCCILNLAGCGDEAKTTTTAGTAEPSASPARQRADLSPQEQAAVDRFRELVSDFLNRSDSIATLIEANADQAEITRELDALKQSFAAIPRLPPEDMEAHSGTSLKSPIRTTLNDLNTSLSMTASSLRMQRSHPNKEIQHQSAGEVADGVRKVREHVASLAKLTGLPEQTVAGYSDKVKAAAPSQLQAVLAWGQTGASVLRYEVKVDEKQSSAVPKFASERTVSMTLALQVDSPGESVTPAVFGVRHYRSSQKDGDGFALVVDSDAAATDTTEATFVDAVRELCQRDYAVGIVDGANLNAYSDWSPSSDHSYAASDLFDSDLQFAISQVLIPVDGGAVEASRSWQVMEDWEELREPVSLNITYQVHEITQSGAEQTATVRFQGTGKQDQGGEPPYTAQVSVEGEFHFDVSDGHLISLSCLEALTTDDALNTSRTRRITVQLLPSDNTSAEHIARRIPLDEAPTRLLRKRTLVETPEP